MSLHNGGGTGWGESINGGFLLCLDGTVKIAVRGVARWMSCSLSGLYSDTARLDNDRTLG